MQSDAVPIMDWNSYTTLTADSTVYTSTGYWILWYVYNVQQGHLYINNIEVGAGIGATNRWADCNSVVVYIPAGIQFYSDGATTFIQFNNL